MGTRPRAWGRAGRRIVGWLAVAVVVGGCSSFAAMPGEPRPVGAVHHLGPVPSFAGGSPFEDTGELVFFRTRDGWSTQLGHGMGCAGGRGPPLPLGFRGFGGTGSTDGTCIETLTDNSIARIEVEPPGQEPVTLRPLGGSADAPINAFAACWGEPFDLDAISATAFDVRGDEVDTAGPPRP